MSIHTFSPTEFENVAKDILKNDRFIGIKKADILDFNSSFRDVLDISSIEIAELIVALEQKYNVDMEWIPTNKVDSLSDLYKSFVVSLAKKRKNYTIKHISQKEK